MSQGNLEGMEKLEKVEDITFELPRPKLIKGYPELVWLGKRPFTQTRYFPAQKRESYGKPVKGWMNQIYWGDNLQVLSHLLKEFRGKVDLVYIDPPFDSKADYKKTIEIRRESKEKNKNEPEIENDHTPFEEKQYGYIWANDEFIQFFYERLILIRELLADNGTIYVHCDWHKSQYIRCLLDEIFGRNNCLNEIIWSYKTTLRVPKTHFGRDHDCIFYYKKKNIVFFHPDRNDFPASEETVKRWKPYADENGFVSNKHFAGSDSTIIDTSDEEKGFNINWGIPRDVWDISTIIGGKAENLNYPTQKPEALLERIIKASTNPGSLVLDCFMGSGTTQAVAMKLGRRFIGADINLGAVETTTKRLINIIKEKEKDKQLKLEDGDPLYLNFQVFNVNNYDMFRNELEAQDLILEAMEIVPFQDRKIFDGMKNGYKVKILSPNRIATPEDLNPIIAGIDYKELNRKRDAAPNEPQEKIMLVCMGHLPDLDIELKKRIGLDYNIDVKVVDILKDEKWEFTFKEEPEVEINIEKGKLVVKQFYPRNLMKKLNDANVDYSDWRELVDSIAIDFDYDGQVFKPSPENVDTPGKNAQVKGAYPIPAKHGAIRIKITDLLSESLEMTVEEAPNG